MAFHQSGAHKLLLCLIIIFFQLHQLQKLCELLFLVSFNGRVPLTIMILLSWFPLLFSVQEYCGNG